MKVVVRADANLTIGTGHLARCRVLANHLKRSAGAEVLFVCRALAASAVRSLHEQGFSVAVLPEPAVSKPDKEGPSHREWLPVSRAQDASDTVAAMAGHGWAAADWLVVDHYALDAVWERMVREHARALLAIDDLADRNHETDILLDQNLRQDGGKAYEARVSQFTRCLFGPRYALLRDEFIGRKRQPQGRNLFVSFGGADSGNYTGKTIAALSRAILNDVTADILVSSQHAALDELRARVETDRRLRLHVDASCVSGYMLRAELGVGAGGVMTWERCAVALPTLATAIAENQCEILGVVANAGAVRLLTRSTFEDPELLAEQINRILVDRETMAAMSAKAHALCDARGAERVVGVMRAGNMSEVRGDG